MQAEPQLFTDIEVNLVYLRQFPPKAKLAVCDGAQCNSRTQGRGKQV